MPHVRTWDLPTRLFKWTLVTLVVLAPISQRYGDTTLWWHKANGYGILTLLAFRLAWGIVGGSTARFRAWVATPAAAARYLLDLARGRPRLFLGHNPAGGYMILALLLAVGAQAVAGLMTTDDVIAAGPLVPLLDFDAPKPAYVRLASWYHQSGYLVILGLAAVHATTNVLYLVVKRENLIGAMITGRKPRAPYEDQAEARFGSPRAALLCLALAAALVLGGLKLFGSGPLL